MAAWRFVGRQGIPADRIAVGGDSAGGNLAIILINRLCAAGEPLPACTWRSSALTDALSSPSPNHFANGSFHSKIVEGGVIHSSLSAHDFQNA